MSSRTIERLQRGVGVVRAKVVFRDCTLGVRVSARGRLRIVADGDVRVGDRVTFASGMFGSELVCGQGGEVVIGPSCVFNGGVSIRARRSVRIGKGCIIASLVNIRDHDADRIAPVVIGDDVWIAHGASIEPGVTIGDGSIVSAGSVVFSDVPPRHLAIGNPAKAIPIQSVRHENREHSEDLARR